MGDVGDVFRVVFADEEFVICDNLIKIRILNLAIRSFLSGLNVPIPILVIPSNSWEPPFSDNNIIA